MSRKRTGQLVWCKSGWRARVTIVVDGAKVRRLIDLGTTYKPAAAQILKRKLRELEASEGSEAPAKVMLNDFAETWFAKREGQGKKSVSTERLLYESYWRGPLGSSALADISQAEVHEVLDGLGSGRVLGTHGRRLSRASVKHVYGVLRRMIASAKSSGVVAVNIVEAIELGDILPEEDARPRAVPTDDEIATFLASPRVDLELKMLGLLSRTVGGMRAGDLNALDWSVFGDDFETCLVPRSKTRRQRGAQELDVPDVVRPFIEAWWRQQGSPGSGPVFPARRGVRAGERKKAGNMSYASRLRRDLGRALGVDAVAKWDSRRKSWILRDEQRFTRRRRELFTDTEHTRQVDFHSFRRAFNTALARANVNAQAAMVLAGHSDMKTHMRYVAASTIRALPEAATPDLASVDAEKATALPLSTRRDRRARHTKSERHRFHSASLGRGEKIRTSDPLTPSQVR